MARCESRDTGSVGCVHAAHQLRQWAGHGSGASCSCRFSGTIDACELAHRLAAHSLNGGRLAARAWRQCANGGGQGALGWLPRARVAVCSPMASLCVYRSFSARLPLVYRSFTRDCISFLSRVYEGKESSVVASIACTEKEACARDIPGTRRFPCHLAFLSVTFAATDSSMWARTCCGSRIRDGRTRSNEAGSAFACTGAHFGTCCRCSQAPR